MPRTKNTHRTWDASDIMIGVGKATWVEVTNSDLGDLRVGDKLLADLTLKKPQAGTMSYGKKALANSAFGFLTPATKMRA